MTDNNEHTPPANSILGNLAARRQTIAAAQTTVFEVPRWTEPKIMVRYGIVDHDIIRRSYTNMEKAKGGRERSTAEVVANADILISGCVEIWAELGDKKYSLDPAGPDAPYTKFDDALAVNLGLNDQATARQVVRSLFFTDGDIIATAQKVIEFSGYKADAIEEAIQGE